MADVGAFTRYKSFADFQEEAQKNNIAQALTMAKLANVGSGGSVPAPMQIANKMFEYSQIAQDPSADPATRAEAEARYNLLGQAAKTYGFDRGFQHNFTGGGAAPAPATSPPAALGAGSPLNPMLPALKQAESGGDLNALSSKGAAGAYQIMPDTARDPGFGVRPLQGWDGKDPRTAPYEEQKRFANDYLNAMQKRFGGDQRLAAASYNAGPGAVDAVIAKLPAETRAYVPKVTGVGTIPGFSQATASMAADKKRAETQAQKDVELGMNPQIKTAEEEAKNIVAARDNYSKAYDSYITGKTVLDRALESPGLDSNFGLKGVILNMPGGEASDAAAILDQIEGGAFLTAFETLKGGGQITEVEGKKATAAIVRAKRAQSADAFRTAIGDYLDVMNRALESARKKASGEVYSQWKDPATAPKPLPQSSIGDKEKAARALVSPAELAAFKKKYGLK